jgi:hypothetical protein
MVNPGAFHGLRKEFLLEQKPLYAAAVRDGAAADCVADIQCRYFKRFPWHLPHDQEPTPECLAAVDDNAVDPELDIPKPDVLTEGDYQLALAEMEKHRTTIDFRKKVRFP